MATDVQDQARSVTAPAQKMGGPARADDDGPAIEIHELTKIYGAMTAVDHLNLTVRRGEIFGFLGPNGAGKTTTMRMLLGLIRPSSGSARVLGMDIAGQLPAILARTGSIIENPTFYPYLSGRDNLRAMARLTRTPDDRVPYILDLVEMTSAAGKAFKTYSLGMKQRLAVGAAMLHAPDLLILDQPANGLDPAGIVEMRDLLRGLAASGKTVFISSHVLSEVQQICTRVAIINHGRLIRVAPVVELLEAGGDFEVSVESPQDVVAILQSQEWGRAARIDGGLVVTRAPEDKGRNLIAFLVQNGHTPDTVSARHKDLADIFLSLTGGESVN